MRPLVRLGRLGHEIVVRRERTIWHLPMRTSTTGAIKHLDKLIIEGPEDAMEIAVRLSPAEQSLLRKALDDVSSQKKADYVGISQEQARSLFIVNALPFVGFGFLDNMIMILAGEYIDQRVGTLLCLSTMAAAALGNLISDVAGVGLAHYVEVLVNKAGVKHPVLTLEQLESSKARWTTNLARAMGLSVGCLIGMFPLIFYDSKKSESPSPIPESSK